MLKWKQQYSCNIVEIDKQHKTLFELGQKLYDIISLKDDFDHYDELMNALEEMKNYTIYHFNYEEKVMEQYNYPELEKQKKEHKAFIDKIIAMKKKDIDEDQYKVCMEMLMFIADWIEKHILKSDMNYKKFLNEKGVY
ncbi:bacteriohemerythrin [Clostridium ganghwense]|uniref:Bacteriohemerythrin n=1 Tax=Clostridium ganghwense TaxID=312089 RepID=A0ABT4CS34_9CLOT|nr:bacteriohemerythrin [Clostridium ganghwense]MCY6371870.1 bacteriohemerythrin [Clostridium ganghwense]